MIIYIILIAVLLGLSAFFSGMESAIFSLSRFRVRTLLFEDRKGAKTVEKIKKEPARTLAAILLSNLLVNIGASSIATIILIELITTHQLNTTISFIIEFIIMTSLLLLIGEITPKVIAFANAEFFALKFSGAIDLICRFLGPIAKFSESFIRRIAPAKTNYPISDKEIKIMLEEAKQFNVIDENEERFGYQILKFGRMKVKEIMTPRPKVVGIDAGRDLTSAKRFLRKIKHSRVCVYDQNGKVCGVLYAKDLFPHTENSANYKVADLMRKPYFVPETKPLDNLLGEFRKKGIHFGIVVDGFGNFTGIVTLEDVLESLFGEIGHEHNNHTDILESKMAPGEKH